MDRKLPRVALAWAYLPRKLTLFELQNLCSCHVQILSYHQQALCTRLELRTVPPVWMHVNNINLHKHEVGGTHRGTSRHSAKTATNLGISFCLQPPINFRQLSSSTSHKSTSAERLKIATTGTTARSVYYFLSNFPTKTMMGAFTQFLLPREPIHPFPDTIREVRRL